MKKTAHFTAQGILELEIIIKSGQKRQAAEWRWNVTLVQIYSDATWIDWWFRNLSGTSVPLCLVRPTGPTIGGSVKKSTQKLLRVAEQASNTQ